MIAVYVSSLRLLPEQQGVEYPPTLLDYKYGLLRSGNSILDLYYLLHLCCLFHTTLSL